MAMIREPNRSGLTAVGGSCPPDDTVAYRSWSGEGRLNKRFYCATSIPLALAQARP